MNEQVLTPEIIIDQCNAPLVPVDAVVALTQTVESLKAAVLEYQHFADTVTVNNETEANAASLTMTAMSNDTKRITQAIEGHKREAARRHKMWTSFENFFVDPIEAARKAVKGKIIAWQQEEQRKAAAEQARLQAIADEQARKEREKLEAQAAKLKTPEKAEERREQAAQVIAPQITIAAPKSGVRMQSVVTCEVVDIVSFVKAAAINPSLCGYIDAGTLASNLKRAKQANSMLAIDGIKFDRKMV